LFQVVPPWYWVDSFEKVPLIPTDLRCSAEQLAGLGRLLGVCSKLEEVDIHCGVPLESLELFTASLSSVMGPSPPLRSWKSKGVTPHLFLECLAQRQQQQQKGGQLVGCALMRLEVTKTFGQTFDLGALAVKPSLTGLRDLRLDVGGSVASPSSLSSMVGLTRLQLPVCGGDASVTMAAVCGLTNLQHLQLRSSKSSTATLELPDSMSRLKQLTALDISTCRLNQLQLPEDLGEWLPRLAFLNASKCGLETISGSLKQLTSLRLDRASVPSPRLPSTLSSTLQELYLNDLDCWDELQGLSRLSSLEVLKVTHIMPNHIHFSDLVCLTRLRHLDLKWTHLDMDLNDDTEALRQLGQLTYLGLVHVTTYGGRPWDEVAPPPALQKLCVSVPDASHMTPWLERMTALTSLVFVDTQIEEGDEVLYLPPQLEELGLVDIKLPQRRTTGGRRCRECGTRAVPCQRCSGPRQLEHLPRGLSRLSALRRLDVSYNMGLRALPQWLTQLQRLEYLSVFSTQVVGGTGTTGSGLRGCRVPGREPPLP
jgi:Leucine-rich repeat (LRR) protein